MPAEAAHSALHPGGPQAARMLTLFYQYFGVAALVFTLVLLALGFALGRRSNGKDKVDEPPTLTRKKERVVLLATCATVLTLLALLVASLAAGHALAWSGSANTLKIEVTGHKWWWEFRYPVKSGATRFSTAYELHIPVGEPVALKLQAHDVIHSFWVPALTGKRDAIPGHDTVLMLQADHPGVFAGQCAEFCGTEHAKMSFLVVAEEKSQFEAWRAHQLEHAPEPRDPLLTKGRGVFMSHRCSVCHTVAGTEAFGTVGPDLTHLAGRRRLAMGTLHNDAKQLASWIADPQAIKPGTQMPSTQLSADDQSALLAYLGTLR